jgi:cobalt-zinc-cadmium efflux system outer membrane protein
MRTRVLPLSLLLVVGCSHADVVPRCVEQHIADVASLRAEPLLVPCAATEPPIPPDKPLDLGMLWDLALVSNPQLREAAAEVQAARGRLIQAGLYPNPRVVYKGEAIGSSEQPKGNDTVEASQEILTAGKRILAREAAARGVDVAGVALLGRKFAVLTNVRRDYYDYLALAYTLRVDAEVVEALERSVEITRKLVEEVKTRPRTDLVRLQALLEQARIARTRTETNLKAAWRQLAAEVGRPELPGPAVAPPLPPTAPLWPEDAVTRRVQSANTELRRAALEAEQARLEYEQARAEAVPNVTVSGGYIRAYLEETAGATIGVETSIPLWDRKQGLIRERRARWALVQASQRTTANRLASETAEAFARYQGAREQAGRLETSVIPRLEESLKLVRAGFYEAGGKDVTFADIQLAIEALNQARLQLAEVRRELWRAVADLQGLMQLDLDEDLAPGCLPPAVEVVPPL